VIDKETNIPIPFIAVKLDDLRTPAKENIRDFTDPDGSFFFDVPLGPYELSIRSPVHSPFTEKIFSEKTLTIKLAKLTY
jgi:hypothetical protein